MRLVTVTRTGLPGPPEPSNGTARGVVPALAAMAFTAFSIPMAAETVRTLLVSALNPIGLRGASFEQRKIGEEILGFVTILDANGKSAAHKHFDGDLPWYKGDLTGQDGSTCKGSGIYPKKVQEVQKSHASLLNPKKWTYIIDA